MAQLKKRCAGLRCVIVNCTAGTGKTLSLPTRPRFIKMEYGRKRICYVRNGEERSDKVTYLKHYAFAIGFLTSAGVLYRGNTEYRIIDNGTKVKRNFYIEKVIKPFLIKKTSHNPFQKEKGGIKELTVRLSIHKISQVKVLKQKR